MKAETIIILINIVAWSAIIFFLFKLFTPSSSDKEVKIDENPIKEVLKQEQDPKKIQLDKVVQVATKKVKPALKKEKEKSKVVNKKVLKRKNKKSEEEIVSKVAPEKPKVAAKPLPQKADTSIINFNKKASVSKNDVLKTGQLRESTFVLMKPVTFQKSKLDKNIEVDSISVGYNPRILMGDWIVGIAIDEHTLKSTPLEIDDNGKVTKWDTTRTDVGELMYKLKYYQNENINVTNRRLDKIEICAKRVLNGIQGIMIKLGHQDFKFDVMVPALPSKSRTFQPVPAIANRISKATGIPINSKSLQKTRETPELKSIEDPAKRAELLKNKFVVVDDLLDEKNILIFDDLYRSGSTVKEMIRSIKERSKNTNIFLLTITKTKSKR